MAQSVVDTSICDNTCQVQCYKQCYIRSDKQGTAELAAKSEHNCASCCQGKSCRKCRAGVYDEPPLLVLYGFKSQEYYERKQRRFLLRAYRGVECGLERGYRFRWFVLTESNEAIDSGLDFGVEFNRFIVWLRYRCPDFQYIVVEHRQGDMKRRNWHVLSYGSDRLPVLQMRDYWRSHYKSTVTGMAEVIDIKKSVLYMAGYLSSRDKFVRSWSSQGWVFRGWLGWSRDYKRIYGDYVPRSRLTTLALMSSLQRSGSLEWLTETGFLDVQECQAGQWGEVVETACSSP